MQGWSKLKKVAVISAVGILGIGGIGALTDGSKTNISPSPAPVVAPTQVKGEATPPPQAPAQPTPAPTPTLPPPVVAPPPSCPNGSYVNSVGNTVCSPYSSPSTPAGATARCVDGTYSFSQSRSGTCSHHGGVAEWL